MSRLATSLFSDWIPVDVYNDREELLVDWCYAGDIRFTRSFFDDTVQEIRRRPFSALFRHQTSLEFLDQVAADEGREPTGFIFHMSRCGSTLAAQMLAAIESCIVISEAAPIDAAIRVETRRTANNEDPANESYFRSMVRVLGRPRSGSEKYYFIKFDSWNTLDLDEITRSFPNVPYIFLYRDPVEVIVSQMRQRGLQMVPGTIENLASPGLSDLSTEDYCANVLARICECALKRTGDSNCLFVNYAQLPEAMFSIIARHFKVSFQPDELVAMRAATRFNAKSPRLYFEPDIERKQSEATDAIREAAKLVEPFYTRLEEIRRAHNEELQ